MKKALLSILIALPLTAHADKQWVDVPDIQRPELQETTQDQPMVVTDARYCTQYVLYRSTGGMGYHSSMVLRVDQNGKPAIARRCTPTDPAPENTAK